MQRRQSRSIALTVLAMLLLAPLACSREPDDEVLQADLHQRLDEHFEDGLFRVESLRRMGRAPVGADLSGHAGILVYYDAELVLQRDYSLTAWKGLNLGTLAFVLGATEAGITGFRPRGNSAGDVLRVHGRLSYHREDGDWVRTDDVAQTEPEQAAAAQDLRGSGPDAVLRGVRDLLARSPESMRGTKDAVIVSELRPAVGRIDLRIARLADKLTFGAGPSPGTYQAFGAAFSEFAKRKKFAFYSYESEGSLENGRRLQDHSLDLALVQSDVAELLYQGWPEEGMFPNRDLRAMASLWPEAVHLVTLEATGVRTLSDLRGRRVAIGRRGSGTRFNAVKIGLAAGLDASDLTQIREIGLARGIAALEAGDIDALFVTEAVPSPGLQTFAARREDVRFITIDPKIVRQLSDEHFAYYPLTVEARSYPGQTEPFHTLGLACTLVTSRHVADHSVERVLELLVDGADELSGRYFRAAFIASDTMRLGIALPLHPAAERFYEMRDAAADEAFEALESADETP